MSDLEQKLSGGNVAHEVVRIGDTVRKPVTAATASVEAFLLHLEAVGFAGVPRSLGRDEQNRYILEYISGSTINMARPLSIAELQRLGRLIRELHNASESFVPPDGAQWLVAIQPDTERLICHHDLAPWNLIRDKDNDRWVFIDWDGSGPGSRLWDLAYASQSFCPLSAGGDPETDAKRLAAIVGAYELDQHESKAFPRLLAERTDAMYQLLLNGSRTGNQPWARLFADGHGEHWRSAADYIRRHEEVWQEAVRNAGPSTTLRSG